MDPVTHGLIGATSAQFIADKKTFRIASIIGFTAALAPDADVFFGSSSNPLLTLELHRQFTHSFIFIPVGALIVSLLLWPFVRKKIDFKTSYLFSLMGYSTAGLMDYITSYGVHLFWPFMDERFALNIVSVFDPLFSLGILIAAILAFYSTKKRFTYSVVAWLFIYLGFASIQKNKVEQIANKQLVETSRTNTELIIKPTIANQLLWSVRTVKENEICAYGIRIGLFSSPILYDGECADLVDRQTAFSSLKGSVLYNDIERFSKLSEGLLVYHPNYPNVLGDARYSMLPTTTSPLWGITIDTTNTNQHAVFDSYRDASSETRSRFIEMLLGKSD